MNTTDLLHVLIYLPILFGLVLFFPPEKNLTVKGTAALALSLLVLAAALLLQGTGEGLYPHNPLPDFIANANRYAEVRIDGLSRIVVLFIAIFSVLILLYALVYQKAHRHLRHFYSSLCITLGAANGAVLCDNLLLFLGFWGLLGLTLYKLIPGRDAESAAAAKKTFILVGGSDSLMILGAGLLWLRTDTFSMSEIHLPTDTITATVAFLCLLAGSFTKAGAFPLHSWIPDFAKTAPATSTAYLPASLDKLLGIYFMARLCGELFVLNRWLTLLLLTLGAVTIIAAVMMALVQHNYKRLLGYHAVSQVGYMVLGLGLGTPLGIAGGLFHMLNHALYKSGLFLVAGSIERQSGAEDLSETGGLSRSMPVTFACAVVFSAAISGIPPLNGFASKWMIYQAIIDFGKGELIANKLWVLWLALAVIGSALTLASFLKFLSGAFLGSRQITAAKTGEVPFLMLLPMVLLALACLGLGAFLSGFAVPELLVPMAGDFAFVGLWSSGTVALLILLSMAVGYAVYLLLNMKGLRREDSFVGGEAMQDTAAYPALEFYKTLGEFRLLSVLYRKAEQKWFDLYDLSAAAVLGGSRVLRDEHRGILTQYALWLIAGMLLIMIILL